MKFIRIVYIHRSTCFKYRPSHEHFVFRRNRSIEALQQYNIPDSLPEAYCEAITEPASLICQIPIALITLIVMGDAMPLSQLIQNLLKFLRTGVAPLIRVRTHTVPATDLPASVHLSE